MLQHILKFSLLLFLVAGITYGLHTYFNQLFFDGSMELINFAYKFNVGITFIFTTSIILASEKLKDLLGFIYLAGGFVKLGVFIYLMKTSGMTISKSVFLHFFIPYVICVIVEIYYVIKLLNATNYQHNK